MVTNGHGAWANGMQSNSKLTCKSHLLAALCPRRKSTPPSPGATPEGVVTVIDQRSKLQSAQVATLRYEPGQARAHFGQQLSRFADVPCWYGTDRDRAMIGEMKAISGVAGL